VHALSIACQELLIVLYYTKNYTVIQDVKSSCKISDEEGSGQTNYCELSLVGWTKIMVGR